MSLDEQRHDGQLAVITGASSNIGSELARLLVDDGFDVVIVPMRRPIGPPLSLAVRRPV